MTAQHITLDIPEKILLAEKSHKQDLSVTLSLPYRID